MPITRSPIIFHQFDQQAVMIRSQYKGFHCKVWSYWLMLLMALINSSCIHTYPSSDEEAVDPTEISVNLVFQFAEEWENIEHAVQPLPEASVATSRSETWPRRLWVVLTNSSGHRETISQRIESDEIIDGSYSLNVTLQAEFYTIAAWSDYLNPETSAPLGYDISRPDLIRELKAHGEETESRMCLSTNDVLDLSPFAGEWNQTAEHTLILATPMARFCLIADDYSDFLEHTEEARRQGEKYYIELKYNTDIPGGFSVYDCQAMDPVSGCGFSSQLPIITMPGAKVPIASDWLFNPEESYTHTVTLTVFNSAKVTVSQARGISFPVERGKLTIVTGNFLTSFITGGVQIDNIWAGEINIEIE